MRLTERAFARRLDIISLQAFVSICEFGSIGRAAECEAMAVSALSKRLSNLEAAVGVQLLYRHTRGVTLTPAGEALLQHVRNMLRNFTKIQTDLVEYGDGVRGHVRMQANTSAIVQYLPEDLSSFGKLHPQVKLELEERQSVDVVRAVQNGSTDLGICSGTVLSQTQGLQRRVYREDELVVVLRADHVLAGETAIGFRDTLDFDQVGLHDNSSIALMMREAAEAELRHLRLRIRVTGLDAMCQMIVNGFGLGIMPRRAFELSRGAAGLISVRLNEPWGMRRIELAARDFASLPVTTRHLVAHLLQRSTGATES